MVRTRFAPSPTGKLHIGGARTALFCFLFSKNKKGTFIIRTEDTDSSRHEEDMVNKHIDELNWLGINEDESVLKKGKYGPYRQSSRKTIYVDYLQKLLDCKKAYCCFCTREEILQERDLFYKNNKTKNYTYSKKCRNLSEQQVIDLKKQKEYSIRYKTEKDEVFSFVDFVRGKVTFQSNDIDDIVIFRPNGTPTYNFAVVVDDIEMEITHVFRGEEHLTNTGKQLMLYKAFNKSSPLFAHFNLIIKEDGKKLSKRDKLILQFISQYKEKGILSSAIVNYLALLGWTPIKAKELYIINELISLFDISKMLKAPSIYNEQKLIWFNKQHIKLLSEGLYLKKVKQFIKKDYFKNEIKYDFCLNQIREKLDYFSQADNEINNIIKPLWISDAIKQVLKKYNKKLIKENLINELNSIETITVENAKNIINNIKEKSRLKGEQLYMPIRILLTGETHGLDLPSLFYIYGKKEINKRLLKNV